MLQPYDDHFHPVTSSKSPLHMLSDLRRRRGSPFAAINIIPREHQVCLL
jgi:hypothetical protein